MRNKHIQLTADTLQDIDKARKFSRVFCLNRSFIFIATMSTASRFLTESLGGIFWITSLPMRTKIGFVLLFALRQKGFHAAAQALYVVGALRMGIAHYTKTAFLMSGINKIVNRSFSEEQFVSMFYAELTDGPGTVSVFQCRP